MKKLWSGVNDFAKRADMPLFFLCCVSTIFGLVLVSSATASYASYSSMIIQTAAFILGIGLFVLFTVIDIEIIADKWIPLFIFDVLFLCTLLVWGVEGDTGNTGWLRFGPIGVQPSEIVKIVYIVIMAKHISYLKEYKNLSSPFSVAQLVAHFGFMFALIVFVSSDLGSALVFLFIFLAMVFTAGLKLYWFVAGFAAVAALTPFVWNNFLREDQRNRIMAPYVPDIDPTNTGVNFQPYRSKLALASGRLTGTGLYNGTQSQSDAFPGKHTDFIFAVAGEELGMIGCGVIILLLLLIMLRCVYVGLRSKNTLSMLVCMGVAATMFFQTFENIGMCVGLTPVIGLTLPFFSYGGSSIVAMFAAMGIVSGIRYRPKPERYRSHG